VSSTDSNQQLAMSQNTKNWRQITPRHFSSFGEHCERRPRTCVSQNGGERICPVRMYPHRSEINFCCFTCLSVYFVKVSLSLLSNRN
jgi:hypothetical protein